AYDLFDMKHYATPNRWMIRWLPLSATNIRTSRGCPNRCRFCAGHVASGLGVRYHSIDYVLQQIRRVVQRFGVKAIHFEDDTLGADSARLLDLCEAIRRSDLRRRICWDGCLRVDQAEPELLAQMKSAGCIQVEYGFESGSDSALRRLGKNATGELNRRAVRLTREAGLRIFADIMFGLPGETEEDFKATINFLRWAKPEVISTSRLAPLPGTPIYDDLPPDVRDSLDWAGYSYLDWPGFRLNLTAMDDQRFEEFYQQTQKYFLRPAMAAALLRDTPLDDAGERRRLRRRLAKFAVQHPIRAARLPVRGLFRELLR
ncbi:MAG: radical SAM protein, partial [Planctomycetia bacterium]|nr:radical SAM protein [Planctomycetia bacterium]